MAQSRWMRAEDTFVATLKDGTDKLVTKGQPFLDSHELVKRDLDASRDNPGRAPLFRPMDHGEEELPKSAPEAEPPKEAVRVAPKEPEPVRDGRRSSSAAKPASRG